MASIAPMEPGFEGDAFQPADEEAFQVGLRAQLPTSDVAFQQDAFQEEPLVTGAGAIGSGEAFGTGQVVRWVGPAGIAAAIAFGTTKAIRVVGPAGIASATAFGTTKARRVTAATGIGSATVFGRPTINGGVQPRLVYPLGFSGGAGWGQEGWDDPWGGGTSFGQPTVLKVVNTGLLLTDLRNTDGLVVELTTANGARVDASTTNGALYTVLVARPPGAVFDTEGWDDQGWGSNAWNGLVGGVLPDSALTAATVSSHDLVAVAVDDELLYSQIETSALAVI